MATTLLHPSSIYRGGVIHLSDHLNDHFEAKLQELGLTDLAKDPTDPKNVHGGLSAEETNTHYARRFPNSLTRVQCVLIDPCNCLDKIPAALRNTLSSHRVLILDIPCGSGASSLSLLSTISEYRREGLLPTTPFSPVVYGADISERALDLYRSHFEKLEPQLRTEGISATLHTTRWDATRIDQTNQLISDWLALGPHAQEHLVLVSNFSGAGRSLIGEFEESFKLIGVRLSERSTPHATILWIEPQLRQEPTWLKRLITLFDRYNWFSREPVAPNVAFSCRYPWFLRIQGRQLQGSVCVHRYSRT